MNKVAESINHYFHHKLLPLKYAHQGISPNPKLGVNITTLPSPIGSIVIDKNTLTSKSFSLIWPNDVSAATYTYQINDNVSQPTSQIISGTTTTALFSNFFLAPILFVTVIVSTCQKFKSADFFTKYI